MEYITKPCSTCSKQAGCIYMPNSCAAYKRWFHLRWQEVRLVARMMRGEIDMSNLNCLEDAVMVGLNSLEAGVASKGEILEQIQEYVASHYIAGHLEALPLELAEQMYDQAGIVLDVRDGRVVGISQEDEPAAPARERRGA